MSLSVRLTVALVTFVAVSVILMIVAAVLIILVANNIPILVRHVSYFMNSFKNEHVKPIADICGYHMHQAKSRHKLVLVYIHLKCGKLKAKQNRPLEVLEVQI